MYLLWLYMHRLVMRLIMHRKHRQQARRALQNLLRKDPAEAMPLTGCIPMEILQIQGKGEVKVTDDFSYRSETIKTVTVASGITGIGDRTFSNCKNLKRISLPGTLRSIGVRAFGDTSITGIKLPNGLKSIGAYAFYQSKITSLDIPKTVTKIEEYAFSYCSSLESVSIPGSVKTLPESLFEADMKLKKVTLGQGVSRIERAAFRHCGLTGISFPDSVTLIDESAFSLVQISEK